MHVVAVHARPNRRLHQSLSWQAQPRQGNPFLQGSAGRMGQAGNRTVEGTSFLGVGFHLHHLLHGKHCVRCLWQEQGPDQCTPDKRALPCGSENGNPALFPELLRQRPGRQYDPQHARGVGHRRHRLQSGNSGDGQGIRLEYQLGRHVAQQHELHLQRPPQPQRRHHRHHRRELRGTVELEQRRQLPQAKRPNRPDRMALRRIPRCRQTFPEADEGNALRSSVLQQGRGGRNVPQTPDSTVRRLGASSDQTFRIDRRTEEIAGNVRRCGRKRQGDHQHEEGGSAPEVRRHPGVGE